MSTSRRRESIHTVALAPGDATAAGKRISRGELVVFPTETVYGLGASAVDPEAIRRVFAAKDRPADNPLISHFATPTEVRDLLPPGSDDLDDLIATWMPGPLTLVVPAPVWAPPGLSGGLDSIALRVPADPIAQAIIAGAGVPVAAPSANRSGRPSPTTFEMAWAEMKGRVAAIIDGGACTIGIESTVVDVRTPSEFSVLRPGQVTAEEISRLTGRTEVTRASDRPRSPGTRYRHYHPGIPVFVVSKDRFAEKRQVLSQQYHDLAVPEFSDLQGYAAGLYYALWDATRNDADAVLLIDISREDAPGLYDRIHRAADEVL